MASAGRSLYDVLGVKKTDSCADIKKAYLKLARTHHPDKGGNEERFKEIQHANEILSDEGRRRLYDEQGITSDQPHPPFGGGGMGGFPFPFEVNMNDLFGNMFGGGGGRPGGLNGQLRKGKKPPPSIQPLPVTLDQYYTGHSVDIHINRQAFCSVCDHSGAKTKETCRACNGQGVVMQVVQIGPMSMHTTGPCTECQGKGEKIIEACTICTGSGFVAEKRKLTVTIAPGTRSHETFIYSEVCSDLPQFERPGDVHIQIIEDTADPAYAVFKRTGEMQQHLETTVSLNLAESLVGCVVRIDHHPGYEDGLFIRIPAGSFHGDRYCLPGFGMPLFPPSGAVSSGKYGDLFLRVEVAVKPSERKLFSTKGREALLPVYGDQIRQTETNLPIQEQLYLSK